MKFSIWRPPYWIHHFEFWKSNFRFVISDPKNPQVQSIRKIDRIVDFTSAILDRHFEIRKSYIGFAIDDLENLRIQSFVETGDFFRQEMNFF